MIPSFHFSTFDNFRLHYECKIIDRNINRNCTVSPDPFIRAGYPQYKGNDGIFASIESLESSNDRIYSKANERKEREFIDFASLKM